MLTFSPKALKKLQGTSTSKSLLDNWRATSELSKFLGLQHSCF